MSQRQQEIDKSKGASGAVPGALPENFDSDTLLSGTETKGQTGSGTSGAVPGALGCVGTLGFNRGDEGSKTGDLDRELSTSNADLGGSIS